MTDLEQQLLAALKTLKDAFDSFTEEANWGSSVLSAATIRKVNEAPFVVNAAIRQAEGLNPEE